MIFDAYERDDASPKGNRESNFEFMNRSARSEIARVREFIESMVNTYPKEELNEIAARIKSGDDTHFRSAIFELVLHEALVKCDCKLIPHPDLANGSTSKPDFLVTGPDGEQFYLEAVLASEINESDSGAEARKGIVMDTLDQNPHDNFKLDIYDKGNPVTQPSGKKLVRELLRWLDSLNPDETSALYKEEGYEAMPVYRWEHDGWTVSFRAIPLDPERRRKCRTLVSSASAGGGIVNAWTPIRDAVKYKGSKYGVLNKPLLVAVNLDAFTLDRVDEMQALFGQEQTIFAVGHPEIKPRSERAPNGAWHGKSGPQYTRVSGVWIFNDLSPYTVGIRRQTIYFNPWASFGLPEFLKSFPHATIKHKKMTWSKGFNLSDLFGLNEGWPN